MGRVPPAKWTKNRLTRLVRANSLTHARLSTAMIYKSSNSERWRTQPTSLCSVASHPTVAPTRTSRVNSWSSLEQAALLSHCARTSQIRSASVKTHNQSSLGQLLIKGQRAKRWLCSSHSKLSQVPGRSKSIAPLGSSPQTLHHWPRAQVTSRQLRKCHQRCKTKVGRGWVKKSDKCCSAAQACLCFKQMRTWPCCPGWRSKRLRIYWHSTLIACSSRSWHPIMNHAATHVTPTLTSRHCNYWYRWAS